MKHYAKMNWYELDDLKPRRRRCYAHHAESIAQSKRIYARRERAVLKRQLAAEIDEWMDNGPDAAYWERELDRAASDWDDLEAAEYRLRESRRWTEEHTAMFAAAYREVSRRANAAYDEWMSAA